MWLLIDDIRNLNVDVIARTPDAGKKLLALGGWECVCLDHDLGFDETGYDVTKWALEEGFMPDKVWLVTSNPVGRQNMAKALLAHDYTSVDGINFKKVS